MANGSMHALYMIKEATYGTTPATPAFLAVRHTKCGFGISRDTLVSEELRSDRQVVELRTGQNKMGGNLDIEIAADAQFDELLAGLMGAAWATNILKAGTTRSSYSMLRHFTDMAGGDKKYHLHTGMEVNSLDLKISSGKLAQGTFNFVGQTLTASTTAPTGATFGSPSTTAPMDSFTGTVTEGGSANGVITELGLKIENGLNQRFVVGSRDSLRPQIGRSVVTGNLSVFFETSTLLDKFLADTASSLVFTLQSGAKSYSFNLPNLKYTSGQAEVQGEGAIMVPMSFQAVYSSGDSTQLAITRVP